ncbi:hypothetical protein F441_16820 [Phytophthora nicotianae CJ01A1]|uniref:Uncharacterized protein n=4 Tax=Phytophthora nicotianae TaxID=4792 RepID=V9EEN6_PHYNI|nr:hypothetical protein F443_16967 [Phytophthora nicotianae P1569]ETK77229.1 hypothetical protein L915_16498 [Phytophthora nicotianae]ETP06848.1 hypothetical protein F441_16820 [Phytophthora nicotianae CJ01A1]ETP34934.1 hypothetical protein F442_16809 [Phytophthora nicotianae P10297]ETL30665.1 hypothetical protein L916_16399 [Phytophthora nicotianae]
MTKLAWMVQGQNLETSRNARSNDNARMTCTKSTGRGKLGSIGRGEVTIGQAHQPETTALFEVASSKRQQRPILHSGRIVLRGCTHRRQASFDQACER